MHHGTLCHPTDAQGRPGAPKPVHGRHSTTGRPGSTAQAAGPCRAPSPGAVSRPLGDILVQHVLYMLQSQQCTQIPQVALPLMPLAPLVSMIPVLVSIGTGVGCARAISEGRLLCRCVVPQPAAGGACRRARAWQGIARCSCFAACLACTSGRCGRKGNMHHREEDAAHTIFA